MSRDKMTFQGPQDLREWMREQAKLRRAGKPWQRTSWDASTLQAAISLLRMRYGLTARTARAQKLLLHHALLIVATEAKVKTAEFILKSGLPEELTSTLERVSNHALFSSMGES